MIEQLHLDCTSSVIRLTSDVVYMQKPYWCNSSAQLLKISVLGPRCFYAYDPPAKPLPCIVFFCGGAFQKQDRMVWLPELTYYAEHGYVVVTADYSTYAYTEFPEQLLEAKTVIRFLRAHAKDFCIDPQRIGVMGESAGGQLAAWLAVTGNSTSYSPKDFSEESDAVQCCATLYPVTDVNAFPAPASIRIRMDNFPDTCTLVTEHTPPFFIAHGMEDHQVPYEQSVRLHDALQEHGVSCRLVLVQGADHSDPRFFTHEIKEQILSFLDKSLKSGL